MKMAISESRKYLEENINVSCEDTKEEDMQSYSSISV